MLDKQHANSIAHSGSNVQQRAAGVQRDAGAAARGTVACSPPAHTHMSRNVFGTESLFNQSSCVGVWLLCAADEAEFVDSTHY